MAGLVDNIMDLARARMGGGITLSLQQCDLAAALAHVVDEVKVAHVDREISLKIDIPLTISVDRLRIAQMVWNLLSNAVTHGDPHSPIELTGRLEAGTL